MSASSSAIISPGRASTAAPGWARCATRRSSTATCRPLVINVMNFNKGDPTLLSFEDARTLFHEMGHGLHGLLSDVTYPTVSCTSVLTDWVELPSQLYEHWFEQPEVLRKFARHYQTGEPIPEALVQKLMAAKNFDRGCQTLEYISSALVDLDLHLLQSADGLDVNAFEKQDARAASACRKRSRCATGRRISPTCSRAATTPRPITATCGRRCSTPTRSRRSRRPATSSIRRSRAELYDNVLSTGGSRDPAELYVAFRGRLPTADALLEEARLRRREPHDRPPHRRTSPRRRRGASRGDGRGRPRHPGRGRQRARSHGGDGGDASPRSIRT